MHPYIDQFPTILHPFITQVQDVVGDGNCGFRAIAACLNMHENKWSSIRRDLLKELKDRPTYVGMFGDKWNQIEHSLDFFGSNGTTSEHWMIMPETGVLIASKYNVILHVLSNADSITHLPLWSSPPPWYEHIAIAIGHVNGNHYVKVVLEGGYLMPYIYPQWSHFRDDCVAAWLTPYLTRLNKYDELLRSNRVVSEVVQID